jgi:radical SAM superfamily enzyme YgiQ (UPF0313 family)
MKVEGAVSPATPKLLARDITSEPDQTSPLEYIHKQVPPSEEMKTGNLVKVISEEATLSVNDIITYSSENPRYKKILFIAPQPHGYDVPPAPTPSFGYLGEVLSEHGFEWRLLDLRLGGDISTVKEMIGEFKPDVIGYTFQFTIGAGRCARFLNEIHQITDLPIIIGGSHLVLRGHNILEDVPFVEVAVQKEGEYPLLAIMKGIPYEETPNLWFRTGEKYVKETPILSYFNELDAIPYPKYPKYDFSQFAYTQQIDILTSRGCPYMCTFCSVALTQGRRFRQRSPENVVEEIRYWYERGIRMFNFIDDILSVNMKRFNKLLTLLEEEKFENVTFSCVQGMRADACSKEMLAKMKNIGFQFLGFGVESASDRILDLMKKGETVAEIEQAVANACELGFDVGLFFIIGNPMETVEDIEKSFNFALRHPVAYAKFHISLPYPGTALAKWVDENSQWYVTPKEYLLNYSYHSGIVAFDNKGMSGPDMKRMVKKSIAIDAMVRRRFGRKRIIEGGGCLGLSRLWRHISFITPPCFQLLEPLPKPG